MPTLVDMTIVHFFGALLGAFLYWFILYLVVRAAIVSAIRKTSALGVTNQLLAAQADLTAKLAKHLIAQTDLTVLTAKNDGLTDEQLAGVMKQVEERKADPGFSMPFS